MARIREFFLGSLVTGLLIVTPTYLSLLLILKIAGSLKGLVRPLAVLIPDWLPGESLLAICFLLLCCAIVGMLAKTRAGKILREQSERLFFARLPGYTTFRSLTQRLAGEDGEASWKPALVEIEEALVPGFIVEKLADGRYAAFVPSVPTPLAGAVYILDPHRVHPIDVPFTQAIRVISRWGLGSSELVAAMAQSRRP